MQSLRRCQKQTLLYIRVCTRWKAIAGKRIKGPGEDFSFKNTLHTKNPKHTGILHVQMVCVLHPKQSSFKKKNFFAFFLLSCVKTLDHVIYVFYCSAFILFYFLFCSKLVFPLVRIKANKSKHVTICLVSAMGRKNKIKTESDGLLIRMLANSSDHCITRRRINVDE